jgi:hypothetical protein
MGCSSLSVVGQRMGLSGYGGGLRVGASLCTIARLSPKVLSDSQQQECDRIKIIDSDNRCAQQLPRSSEYRFGILHSSSKYSIVDVNAC